MLSVLCSHVGLHSGKGRSPGKSTLPCLHAGLSWSSPHLEVFSRPQAIDAGSMLMNTELTLSECNFSFKVATRSSKPTGCLSSCVCRGTSRVTAANTLSTSSPSKLRQVAQNLQLLHKRGDRNTGCMSVEQRALSVVFMYKASYASQSLAP